MRRAADRLARRRKAFEALVTFAEDAAEPQSRIVRASFAATYASRCPIGSFDASRLERLLEGIPAVTRSASPGRAEATGTILHVATTVHGIGGHTHTLCRWMEHDQQRSHRLVLTAQGARDIPPRAMRAVGGPGRIRCLSGSTQARAAALAREFAGADIVVLHIHPFDCVPLMATQSLHDRPPVIFVDHADHVFWIGGNGVDVFAHTRPAAVRMARDHRGIAPERSTVLPIPVDEPARAGDARTKERAVLEVGDDAFVLLTVASEYKYAANAGEHLLDALDPLLERDERLHVVAVGPRAAGRWAEGAERWGGRVRALGTRTDLRQLLCAADAYVDSYPLPSFTTLLEAANAGLPCIAQTLDHVGLGYLELDDPALASVTRVADDTALVGAICAFADDPIYRARVGEALAEQVAAGNRGEHWLAAIEHCYAVAREQRGSTPSRGPVPVPLPEALALGLAEFHRLGEVDSSMASALARTLMGRDGASIADGLGVAWCLRGEAATLSRGVVRWAKTAAPDFRSWWACEARLPQLVGM